MHDLSTNTANSLTARANAVVRPPCVAAGAQPAALVGAVARAPFSASVRPVTSPATQAVAAGAQPAAAAVEADHP